jgi:hypothetical protein
MKVLTSFPMPSFPPAQVWAALAVDRQRGAIRLMAEIAVNFAIAHPRPLPTEVSHVHSDPRSASR